MITADQIKAAEAALAADVGAIGSFVSQAVVYVKKFIDQTPVVVKSVGDITRLIAEHGEANVIVPPETHAVLANAATNAPAAGQPTAPVKGAPSPAELARLMAVKGGH